MPALNALHARLYLLRAAEPPAPATHQYVAIHGPTETAEHIRRGTAPAAVFNEITQPDARIDAHLQALDSGTARLLTPDSDEWPARQMNSLNGHGVPLALSVRGNTSLAELTSSAVTVTGDRVSSAYGYTVACDIGYELGRAGADHRQRWRLRGGRSGSPRRAHRRGQDDRRARQWR